MKLFERSCFIRRKISLSEVERGIIPLRRRSFSQSLKHGLKNWLFSNVICMFIAFYDVFLN